MNLMSKYKLLNLKNTKFWKIKNTTFYTRKYYYFKVKTKYTEAWGLKSKRVEYIERLLFDLKIFLK